MSQQQTDFLAEDIAGAASVALPTREEAAAVVRELAADWDDGLCLVCGEWPTSEGDDGVCGRCASSYHATAEERF